METDDEIDEAGMELSLDDSEFEIDSDEEESSDEFDPAVSHEVGGVKGYGPGAVAPLCRQIVASVECPTNRYANAEIAKQRPLLRESRLWAWKDTDAAEMKKFLGPLIHIGPNNLPTLEHYWTNDPLYKTEVYGKSMGRNRFQLLLRFWHFSENSEDRLIKIRPLLDYFDKTMSEVYYPKRDLCMDESMVLWRGRLLFRQYIKNKRHKYGVKLYELCESDGMVLKILIYSGTRTNVDDDLQLGQSAAVVLHLMSDFLDKGHVLYTDNYYNLVDLTKALTDRSTYLCETLRFDRKENPKDDVQTKLEKGEHCWKRPGPVVVCKWRDKRDVLTITNMHNMKMVNVTNRNQKVSQKPNIVRDYNNGMSGIDRSDQMLSYYSALRKTIRWYKKIGLHVLEIMLFNAHIMYNESVGEQMRMLRFREKVTLHLLGNVDLQPTPTEGPPAETFHHLVGVPPTEKKERPTKPCHQCTKNGRRRETRYICPVCPEKPALCVDPYFKVYHVL
ncbi:piggyBac transposable element-derived protein 4-like [Liolophura sinensis]|uniref:piggyBac transposable element-derived protein 4-like n=1 Tax=Liolophura sinensis TaxID=3198878 RepID=UPI0031581AC4